MKLSISIKKKWVNWIYLAIWWRTPRFGCSFLTPIVDFGASTGTVEFKKSTLGAPVGAVSDFGLGSSFFGAIWKWIKKNYIVFINMKNASKKKKNDRKKNALVENPNEMN